MKELSANSIDIALTELRNLFGAKQPIDYFVCFYVRFGSKLAERLSRLGALAHCKWYREA